MFVRCFFFLFERGDFLGERGIILSKFLRGLEIVSRMSQLIGCRFNARKLRIAAGNLLEQRW